MSLSLNGALVTGGARRLGRAMALELAARGHDVALHYFGSADDAEKTRDDIMAMGVNAVVLERDLVDPDAVGSLVPDAAAALGKPLNVLINNASVFEYDTLDTATAQSWDWHVGSNLRAPVFLTQAFAGQVPKARRDERGEPFADACVINMIDQRVRKLTPEFMTYTIAKMGLWAFTQTAAQALAPDIRVNGIGPGPTMQGARQSARHFNAQRQATVLGRGSNPEDIVGAMRYLLNSPAVTGQLLCVDGGQHLGWETPDILGVE